MNWLIYISGWYWGYVIVNSMVKNTGNEKVDNALFVVTVSTWIMTWIWICWKFIR